MQSKDIDDERCSVITALTQVAETMALRDVLLPALHETGRQDLPTDAAQLREFVLGPLREWAARSMGADYSAQVIDQLMPLIEEGNNAAVASARRTRSSVFRREGREESAGGWPRRSHATTEQDPTVDGLPETKQARERVELAAVVTLLVTANERLHAELGHRLHRSGATVATTASLRQAKHLVNRGGIHALLIDHSIADHSGSWHQTALLQSAKLQNVKVVSLMEAGDTRRFGGAHRITLSADIELVVEDLAHALQL